jgi:hypothetical protein
MDGR